jgi:hypothetical protein
MKSWYTSKTLWLAIFQAVAGAVLIFHTSYPDVGWIVVAKSVVDICLRLITTQVIN